jgi:hypothetical protein
MLVTAALRQQPPFADPSLWNVPGPLWPYEFFNNIDPYRRSASS